MKTKTFWLVSFCLIAIFSVAQLAPNLAPLARRAADKRLNNHFQSVPSLSFVRTDIPVGNFPVSLAVADFNGDGKLDVAVLADTDPTAVVSIYLGDGTGQFTFRTSFSTSYPSVWIDTADLNGDGFADLVVANGFGRSVSVFLALGDGTFGQIRHSFAGTD